MMGIDGGSLAMADEYKRLLPIYTRIFEERGIDYTKGFLAALQGSKPLWLLKFMDRMGISQGPWVLERAAKDALRRLGIDPLTCGQNFYTHRPSKTA